MFVGRGEPGASEIMQHLFDADYLVRSTISFSSARRKRSRQKSAPPRRPAVFNVFMGEFNFADLPEADLMRSIRLFGEKVIPALRGYEPF